MTDQNKSVLLNYATQSPKRFVGGTVSAPRSHTQLRLWRLRGRLQDDD